MNATNFTAVGEHPLAGSNIGWSGIATVLVVDISLKFASFIVFSLSRRFCLKNTRNFFVTRRENAAKSYGSFRERVLKFVLMSENDVKNECGCPDAARYVFFHGDMSTMLIWMSLLGLPVLLPVVWYLFQSRIPII
jgi:hypothetical protein